ncbi:hypothetical protein LMG26788_02149 [Achromobacter pulmonis]|uniref:Uncharacterized protein n=1 Tax=Achromobacter pulmonis TaxID=1389932 RepID=A0A6S7D3L3_9BURK|nr:hypothetical protein [Achromobacter pulmonis]CAB3858782.1 hypothetical protein LMG26788_02149 [Achromobacter pulmonis]
MRGMLLGAGLALGGVVAGFVFATKIDAMAEAKWWDLMTAIGTCATAVVAVAVPWWERVVAARHMAERELLHRLAAWDCAVDAIHSLDQALEKFTKVGVLKVGYCESTRDTLLTTSSGLQDVTGIEIYRTLVIIARAMHGHAIGIAKRKSGDFGWIYRASKGHIFKRLSKVDREAIYAMRTRCEELRKQAELWKAEILEAHVRAGVVPATKYYKADDGDAAART